MLCLSPLIFHFSNEKEKGKNTRMTRRKLSLLEVFSLKTLLPCIIEQLFAKWYSAFGDHYPPPPNRVSYLLCCFFFCRFNFFPNGGSTLWARFVLACGNVFAFFLLWKVGFSRFQFQNQCYTMLLDTASVSVVMTPDEFNTDFLSTFLTF